MRKILVILFLFSFTWCEAQTPLFKLLPKRSSSFSPRSVANCVLWVYSDTLGLANNDPVATWTDLSGNGNNAAQSSASLKPLYKTNIQNSRAAILFDGTDDFMDIANTSIIGGGTGLTVFLVVKESSLSTNKAMFSKWDYATDGTFAIQTSDVTNSELTEYIANGCTDAGGNHQNSSNASLGTNFYILEFVYDGTQATNADRVKIYVNGTEVSYITVGTIATSLTSCSATLKIGMFGGSLSRNYNGYMGEIAAYTAALGSTDRDNIRAYLNAHWACY